jgi:hypothetical protein
MDSEGWIPVDLFDDFFFIHFIALNKAPRFFFIKASDFGRFDKSIDGTDVPFLLKVKSK